MTVWITCCPFSGKMRCYPTKEEAQIDAIRRNQKDHRHPAYRLFRARVGPREKRAKYVGRLWREFGMDFNPDDCWRKE